MKHKVLVTDKLSDKGLSILKAEADIQVDEKLDFSPEELKDAIKGYDAILIRSGTTLTADILESADTLKVVGRAGVGVDNVDVDTASKKGIVVMNAPSGNTLSTAELTISMLLSLARNIPQANASMKQKKWARKDFMGTELFGKILGVIGFGRIGREVAKRMLSFGMEIVAYDPYAVADTATSLGVTITNDLADVYKVADFITLHTPLTDETRNMINTDTFPLMKDGVRIINCARGGLVNEMDLVEAVKSGKVAGAAFDAYLSEPPEEKHPFYDLDQIIMTPHLGASTREAQENVAIDVANQVVDMLLNGCIKNAVNYLQVSPEVYTRIEPFLGLAEKMGSFVGSMKKGRHSELVVQYCGDLAELETTPLTAAVIKGLLIPILEDDVNDVNARFIAKERGIQVNVETTSESKDFASLLNITLKMEDGSELTVAGTTFGKNDLRIVRIDGYNVDLRPHGAVLICKNIDKPGFVGRIGSILGENNINIASMTLGCKEKGEHALVVFNIDDVMSDKVLSTIKNVEDTVSAVALTLS
jgi:D-3-phosphoglycerate dehydrogenase